MPCASVVGKLYRTATLGFVYGLPHGVCDLVGIHDYFAVEVSSGTADCLRKRAAAAKESFLVGIENGYKRNFRQVESLAEKVYTDKYVVGSRTQSVENLDTVEGVDVAVYI